MLDPTSEPYLIGINDFRPIQPYLIVINGFRSIQPYFIGINEFRPIQPYLIGINSFRPIQPYLVVDVLATQAKFLEPFSYCNVINCAVTFRTTNVFVLIPQHFGSI